jgi:plasmid maintenance system antidote protein VapI
MRTDRKRTRFIELRHISEELISYGYTSLDEQAKALGLHRNTAWTIVKNKHKLGRLSAKTIDRILNNPQTPPTVRAIIQQYVAERPVSNRRKPKQKGISLQKSWVGTKRGLWLV